MPEPGLRPSTGIARFRRYHEPLRLPHGPRLTISDHPGWWPRPTTYVDLARCSKTLSAHADPTTPAEESGFFGRLLPRPPTAFPFWQEGRLQLGTIEACSGFMCFSACAFAPRLHRGLPRRLQPDDYSSSAAPVATGRTDNSPGGTFTRWPSRPRRSLRNLTLSSRQTSFRAALPASSADQGRDWREGGCSSSGHRISACHLPLAVERQIVRDQRS